MLRARFLHNLMIQKCGILFGTVRRGLSQFHRFGVFQAVDCRLLNRRELMRVSQFHSLFSGFDDGHRRVSQGALESTLWHTPPPCPHGERDGAFDVQPRLEHGEDDDGMDCPSNGPA